MGYRLQGLPGEALPLGTRRLSGVRLYSPATSPQYDRSGGWVILGVQTVVGWPAWRPATRPRWCIPTDCTPVAQRGGRMHVISVRPRSAPPGVVLWGQSDDLVELPGGGDGVAPYCGTLAHPLGSYLEPR